MKKIISLVLVLLLSLSFSVSNFSEEKEIKIFLDGNLIIFDTSPVIINGRTMVPVGKIFEALGLSVSWDANSRKVTGVKDGLEVILFIDSDTPTVNGETVKIDAKAYIANNRTMVPLRFIAESTGAEVNWNGEKFEISIDSKVIVDETVLSYKIVDTGVTELFTDKSTIMSLTVGDKFYGQDGNYIKNEPNYTDNNDGTITDNVTGLMWQKTMDGKMTFEDSESYASNSSLAGYSDWRVPTIKELFSLILFTGESGGEVAKKLYIDTGYFDQPIGDTSIGEREIDAQVWSSTEYVGVTMHGDKTVFGVNFVDGRIKGYGRINPKTKDDNTAYYRLVRDNTSYGVNKFVDNMDGTITDLSTGLMWQMSDDGVTRGWEEALSYSENLELANHSDWRLPNVKELQSIVDYTKSLQTTDSAAISDLFTLTEIVDPNGNKNYGFYWTSTTHKDGNNISDSASYVSFGEAQGEMFNDILDVHGCGAVRSDPKSGEKTNYPEYFGPQGDIRYVYNYVLSVRDN